MCGLYHVFQKCSEKVHTWQRFSAMCEPIACTCWCSEPSRIGLQSGKPPPLYHGAGVSPSSTPLTKWSVCTLMRESCPSVFQHGHSLWQELSEQGAFSVPATAGMRIMAWVNSNVLYIRASFITISLTMRGNVASNQLAIFFITLIKIYWDTAKNGQT